jgi:PAS domain S-box-containing protein
VVRAKGATVVRKPKPTRRAAAPDKSPDFFRTAVEAAPNAMIMVDSTGRIAMINGAAERMFGYSRKEMIGSKIEMLLPEGVRTRHIGLRDEYLRKPETRAMGAGRELLGRRKDGSEVPVEIGLNPIHAPGGVMVLASIVDITERLRALREKEELEGRVRHSQKLESLGVLAGGIAHDFNNLLSAILGNAELALMQVAPDSPAAKHLDRIFSTARRAAELSRQMLAYSGRGLFEVKNVNLSQIVREIAELLNVSVSKKARVRMEFAPDLPVVEADTAQLNQVVMNLITNASEALEDKPGEIAIRTGLQRADHVYLKNCVCDPGVQPGPFVFVEVEDTGSGMDEAARQRIFEPFFTTKFTGRGLGLAAVLGIVRAHKGALHVRSRKGQGTTMRVLFPAHSSPDGPAARATQVSASWRGKGLVLIADDEEFVRAVTRAQLEAIGFEVMEAEDGEEALKLFKKHARKIMLVVLDLTMPRMDGDKAATRMLSSNADLPVILASGYSAQEISQRLRDHPAVVMLPKPFSLSDLQAAVQRALKV